MWDYSADFDVILIFVEPFVVQESINQLLYGLVFFEIVCLHDVSGVVVPETAGVEQYGYFISHGLMR